MGVVGGVGVSRRRVSSTVRETWGQRKEREDADRGGVWKISYRVKMSRRVLVGANEWGSDE